jgi:hypothetical protein
MVCPAGALLGLAHCTSGKQARKLQRHPWSYENEYQHVLTTGNSQQGRCEMQIKQDLVTTNVNMYRVTRKRRKPKNSSNKYSTALASGPQVFFFIRIQQTTLQIRTDSDRQHSIVESEDNNNKTFAIKRVPIRKCDFFFLFKIMFDSLQFFFLSKKYTQSI